MIHRFVEIPLNIIKILQTVVVSTICISDHYKWARTPGVVSLRRMSPEGFIYRLYACASPSGNFVAKHGVTRNVTEPIFLRFTLISSLYILRFASSTVAWGTCDALSLSSRRLEFPSDERKEKEALF